MKLKLLVCGCVASAMALAAFTSFAVPQGWLDDYETAKAKAAAEGKKMLMIFSADWCGFCKALDREVLSSRNNVFTVQASKSCVLLYVDASLLRQDSGKNVYIPRDQRPKGPAPWVQELCSKFRVYGYPEMILTDASGDRRMIVAGGYLKGGPTTYLKLLDCALALMDEAVSGADLQQGETAGTAHVGKCGKDCCKYTICPCCRKNKGKCCPDNGAKPGYFDDAPKHGNEPGAKGAEAQSDAKADGAALNRGRCGKDCCKNKICSCCKKNNGKCCPDNGAPAGSFMDSSTGAVKVDAPATNALVDVKEELTSEMVRLVNGYELRIEDASLSADLDRLAKFFEKVSDAFNRETGGYYAGQKHHYAGILLHADSARRGEKSKFIGSRNFYSMYLPDNMEDKSWCYFLCDSFLSRTKGHSNKEMQMRDQMLVYVGYRVAATIGLEGAAAALAGIGEEKKGVRRLMHELTNIKEDAVSEYYRAKVRLAETERIGIVVSVHDVAEIFSGVVGRDVFALFDKFGLNAQKKKVSPRLVGFFAEKGTPSIGEEGVRQ